MNKQKMAELLNRLNGNSSSPKIDYDSIFWKPSFGEHEFRIVPSAYDADNPFKEVRMHYGIAKSSKGKYYGMASLSNFGQKDPIEQFAYKLFDSTDEEDRQLAKKLLPRSRYYVPVIVRGEESKGVRLWAFGITVFKEFVELANDEDIEDYTHPMTGYDFKLTKKQGAKSYPESNVRIKLKSSPLSNNPEDVQNWLTNQPNIMTTITKDGDGQTPKFDYEFIQNALERYLRGDETTEEPQAQSTNTQPASSTSTQTTNSSNQNAGDTDSFLEGLNNKTTEDQGGKVSQMDEFDQLFNK